MYIAEIKNGNITTQIHAIKEKLKAGNIVKGINTIDSFSFTMLMDNPGFNKIYDYKTLVSVYNTNKNRYDFLGRVLRSNDLMDDSGLITKEVICESYLGFLCDRQQDYVTERNWTVRELLTHIISCHNSQVESYKNFAIGEITVEDKNDNLYLGIQRENSFDTIQTKLIEKLGGEIQFRVVNDTIYLDYLTKIGTTRATSIKLSDNMKSITKEQDPTAIVTRLIPLGAKIKDAEGNETEERLDITSVNNGLKYIDAEDAIAVYGIRCGYAYFDDVTVPSNLYNKGLEYLIATNKVQVKYTVSALDLSLLGKAYDDFEVHYYYPLENSLIGIDDKARVIKQNIDIVEEYLSTFELGDQQKTLTDIQLEQKKENDKITQLIGSTKNELKELVSSAEKNLNSKIEGIDGVYFYYKYSQYADGHEMTDAPDANTKYMGVCSTNTPTAPTDYKKYTWHLCRGADGENGKDGANGSPGAAGADGKTQYLHIKYSDDGATFTANNGETLGAWIGTLVDFTEADSTTFSDYTWKKFTDDVDEELEDIRNTITEQHTTITNDCQAIILSALSSYTEKSRYDELKQTLEAQIKLISDELAIKFTQATEEIESVNGDLQTKYNTITKHFTFNIDGLTIGQANSPFKVVIDNDEYTMLVNNIAVLTLDPDGNSVIPDLKITKKLTLLGFIIEQDSNGNVNCAPILS